MGEKRRRLRADCRVVPFPKETLDADGDADPVRVYAHLAGLGQADRMTCPNCGEASPRETIRIIVAKDRVAYFSQRRCPACQAMFSIRAHEPTEEELASDLVTLRDMFDQPVH
jgi:hypothetical protein